MTLRRRTWNESKRIERAEAPLPPGQERHPPHLRLLCQRQSGDRLLPGRIHGPHARGGVRPVLRIFEENPVGHPGQAAHRHCLFHPAGGGQPGAQAPLRPAGLPAEGRPGPGDLLPQNYRRPGAGRELSDPPGPRRLRRAPPGEGRPASGGLGHGVLLSGLLRLSGEGQQGGAGLLPRGERVPQPGRPGGGPAGAGLPVPRL